MNFNMEFFENSYRLQDASLPVTESENSRWLKGFRETAFHKAQGMGLPSRKIESWKYTNLEKLTKGMKFLVDFEDKHGGEPTKLPEHIERLVKRHSRGVVFFNGEWSESLSWGVDGNQVIIQPLGEFFQGRSEAVHGLHSEEIKGWLSGFEEYQPSGDDSTVFAQLNSALAHDGYLIRISPETMQDDPIQVVYLYGEQAASDRASRNVIVVGDRSGVSLAETHWALDDVECITNTVTDIYLGISSTLDYMRSYVGSDRALNFGQIRGNLLKDSRAAIFNLNSGGAVTRSEVHIQLEGEGASVQVNGLALLGANQHLDSRSTINHLEANTMSRQLYKGVLNDSSHSVFNGKIYIAPNAQNVDSDQLNQNLLLGEKAQVDTKPELEVYADDVKATHGATVGQMSEDELFYLLTRAISREDAIAMLARGFVEDVILKEPSGAIKKMISGIVDINFDQFLEALKNRIEEGEVDGV